MDTINIIDHITSEMEWNCPEVWAMSPSEINIHFPKGQKDRESICIGYRGLKGSSIKKELRECIEGPYTKAD